MSELHDLDLAKAGGNELFEAIQSFAGVSLPSSERQSEGYTVDFKEEWGDRSLRVVAGFANTFGGIIVVGVTEVNGRAGDIVGVPASRDIKTKIASSIASNISPTPDYEIAECALPTDSSRRVAVIRVRARPRIHYFLKGEHPVYIRNEDQARPARAAELRSLVEREHASFSSVDFLADSSTAFTNSPTPTKRENPNIFGRNSRRVAADCYMRALLVPQQRLALNIDYEYEEKVKRLIGKYFPTYVNAVTMNVDSEKDIRGADTYIYTITRDQPDIEAIWMLVDTGMVGFAVNIALPFQTRSWSLPDVAANVISTVRLANDVLASDGYWGEAQVNIEINPNGTGISCEGASLSSHLRKDLYPEGWPSQIFPQFDPRPTTWHGTAGQLMNFDSRSAGIGLAIARILNRSLRGLGYSADFEILRAVIEDTTSSTAN